MLPGISFSQTGDTDTGLPSVEPTAESSASNAGIDRTVLQFNPYCRIKPYDSKISVDLEPSGLVYEPANNVWIGVTDNFNDLKAVSAQQYAIFWFSTTVDPEKRICHAYPLLTKMDADSFKLYDLEGLTADGTTYYATGSLSLHSKDPKRDIWFRFQGYSFHLKSTRDPVLKYQIADLEWLSSERRRDLREWFISSYDFPWTLEEITGRAETGNGLNVEGLAISHDGNLMFGFRGPVPDSKHALVMEVTVPDTDEAPAFVTSHLVPMVKDNYGIRGITRIEYHPNLYAVISGPTGPEKERLQVLIWDAQKNTTQKCFDLPDKFVGEGIGDRDRRTNRRSRETNSPENASQTIINVAVAEDLGALFLTGWCDYRPQDQVAEAPATLDVKDRKIMSIADSKYFCRVVPYNRSDIKLEPSGLAYDFGSYIMVGVSDNYNDLVKQDAAEYALFWFKPETKSPDYICKAYPLLTRDDAAKFKLYDLEGVGKNKSGTYYAIGSLSLHSKTASRDIWFRYQGFRFQLQSTTDPVLRHRAVNLSWLSADMRRNLREWFISSSTYPWAIEAIKGRAETAGGLNVEGLEVSHDGNLLVGFRGPMLDRTHALIFEVTIPDTDQAPNLVKVHKVPVQKPNYGIRGISRIKDRDGLYIIITGPTDTAHEPMQSLIWDSKLEKTTVCRETLPDGFVAEGVAQFYLSEAPDEGDKLYINYEVIDDLNAYFDGTYVCTYQP